MALIQANFTSSCLKRPVQFTAVIPVDSMFGAPSAEVKPFKTLYLLHGYSGSCQSWLTDSVLSSITKLGNIAVIMANDENHFYVDDMMRLDMYGEHVGRELVEYTRSIFPLSTKREDTIIGGISMGGYGAIRNGLKYNDTFGHIVGISPALVYQDVHNSKDGPGGITRGYFEMVFGDLDKVLESDMNPTVLAKKILDEGSPIPNMYFATGYNDMLVFGARKLHAELEAIGFPHFYEEGPGSHENFFFEPHMIAGLERCGLDKAPPFKNPFWIDAEVKA
ncbi:MAG: acetylesterase [Papillibacter sp.]|jgi:putative tributyrin esterase|nr:acetylesterase [Papillibacter sp.]